MKRLIVVFAASCLLLAGVGQAHAGLYAASADAENTVTVSGSWSVSHYKADPGCYSGMGDSPALSDYKSHAESNTPVNLSTAVSDATGSAASAITVSGTTIDIDADADVHDYLDSDGRWAIGYSAGGANWLYSSAAQSVTVTCDYSYALDLSQADPLDSRAYAIIYVGFWDTGLMLSEKDGFVDVGGFLKKEIEINTAGTTDSGSGTTSWDLNVSSGYCSFWAQADAMGYTLPEPATLGLLGLGLAAAFARRRRKR